MLLPPKSLRIRPAEGRWDPRAPSARGPHGRRRGQNSPLASKHVQASVHAAPASRISACA